MSVTTFGGPSGPTTFARGRSPTVVPRGRGPTPTGRTLERQRSVKTFNRKCLPRRLEVGVSRRCYVTRVVALFADVLTSPRFYRWVNSAKLPPYKRGRGVRVAFTLSFFTNLRQLVSFDTRHFSIRPILRGMKATRSIPSLRSGCGKQARGSSF